MSSAPFCGNFSYSYKADSDLLERTTYLGGTVTVHRTYDDLNRLTSISATNAQTSAINSFSYTLDSVGRRTKRIDAGNSRIDWGYDTKDQLVSASRTNGPNGAADAAYQYGYAFDEVGNRTNEIRGQTVLDGSFNALNQIRTLNWSGSLDVLGQIGTTNNNPFTVLVNASTATVYNVTNFLGGTTLSAGSNTISIVTKDTVPTTNETVKTVFAPPVQPRVFTWDRNGNMTSDGFRDYTWNEQNRCTNIETSAAAVAMGLRKLKSMYVVDGLGRRVESRDYSDWNGTNYSTTNITRFVWGGLNVIAVLNEDNSIRSYVVRGLDLSQSLQGAGGIGGILAMHHQGTNFLYTTDGNGNVTHVTDDQGAVVASYFYSPFGKLVSQSGSFASENPWMFSSQWYESRWKHYRYVYRIYLPDIGWASADPLGERGGINRYVLLGNNAIQSGDWLGLLDYVVAAIGDSLTHGDKPRNGWKGQGYLQALKASLAKMKEHSFSYVEIGAHGKHIDHILPLLTTDKLEADDECDGMIFIYFIGMNDMIALYNAKEWEKEWESLVTQELWGWYDGFKKIFDARNALEPKRKTIFLAVTLPFVNATKYPGPPPKGWDRHPGGIRMNDYQLPKFNASMPATYMETLEWWTYEKVDLSGIQHDADDDGLHFNAGNTTVAEKILQAFKGHL